MGERASSKKKSVDESFLETLNDDAMVTLAGDLSDHDSCPSEFPRYMPRGRFHCFGKGRVPHTLGLNTFGNASEEVLATAVDTRKLVPLGV